MAVVGRAVVLALVDENVVLSSEYCRFVSFEDNKTVHSFLNIFLYIISLLLSFTFQSAM